jgi:dethiobiotin synthetase
MADFAARLGLPSPPRCRQTVLGCINHALLTLESIRTRRMRCPGIILNTLTNTPDVATRTNREVLEKHAPILLEIRPGQTDISPADLVGFLEKVQ